MPIARSRLRPGQRAQEEVDRHAYAAGPDRRGQPQRSSADAQVLSRGDAVDVIRLDRCVALDLDHGHGRAPPDAAPPSRLSCVGSRCCHDDESHAAVGGHGAEELGERLEASGRRAHADDRQDVPRGGGFRGGRGVGTPGRRARAASLACGLLSRRLLRPSHGRRPRCCLVPRTPSVCVVRPRQARFAMPGARPVARCRVPFTRRNGER